MIKWNRFLSSVLTAAVAAIPFFTGIAPAAPQGDGEIHAFAFGPGAENLSASDQYAIYQWGLKNDGQLQLVELKEKFTDADDMYGADGHKTSLGLPRKPEPGDFKIEKTRAVPGVDINVISAWKLYDEAQNKRQVTVALIDSGIDFTHPELQNALWTNPGEIPDDGVDNDGNGYVDDIHGWDFFYGDNVLLHGKEDNHGTHAAGTIGAARQTGGMVGITDNNYVKIMSVKALGSSLGVGEPETVVEAIKYAEANGASICNLSFGTVKYSKELDEAIKNSNMLFIVAAGNGDSKGVGYDNDTSPVYPASLPYDNVISVANLMFDGTLDPSSNYGAVSVDIAAPGSYIVSTIPGGYGFMSGTSMAAPMVTGVAAMLYSYRPDMSLSDVKNILLSSARKMESLDKKVVTGGMLDAYAALSYQG